MKTINKKEHIAPKEKAFDRVFTPLDEFIHYETTSAVLLIVCTVFAFYLANSQWYQDYHLYLKIPFISI